MTTRSSSIGTAASIGKPAKNRGRPPGTKNKPKAVISQAALRDFQQKVGPYLPLDDMVYLTDVLQGTRKPEIERDLDIFLVLQLKAILPQLVEEIKEGSLSREATQRSSTVKELLSLRFQMQKHEKGEEQPNHDTFVQNIFLDRGLDPQRLASLVGLQPERSPAFEALPVGFHRSTDQDARQADDA